MTLLLLKFRAWLGWWRHPDALRWWSGIWLRMFRTGMLTTLVLLSFVILAPPLLTLGHLQWPLDPLLLRQYIVLGTFLLLTFVVLFLLPALTARTLARRGADGALSIVYGRCFATLTDPPGYFFARIGLAAEQARWYRLPLAWESEVVPSDVQLDLTVLPATGWVERLRQPGPPQRELVQLIPEFPRHVTFSRANAEPETAIDYQGDATRVQQRAMIRFARRASLSWRASPRALVGNGWAFLASGAFLCYFPVALFAYLGILRPPPGSPNLLLIFLPVFGAVGLLCIALGLHCLRLWRRVRHFSHVPPATTTGEVLAWLPYRDMWSPSDWQRRCETLITVGMPDGQTHIFRIPIRYLHRVRVRGAHVRITYIHGTERMLDVVRAESSAHAPVETASPD